MGGGWGRGGGGGTVGPGIVALSRREPHPSRCRLALSVPRAQSPGKQPASCNDVHSYCS